MRVMIAGADHDPPRLLAWSFFAAPWLCCSVQVAHKHALRGAVRLPRYALGDLARRLSGNSSAGPGVPIPPCRRTARRRAHGLNLGGRIRLRSTRMSSPAHAGLYSMRDALGCALRPSLPLVVCRRGVAMATSLVPLVRACAAGGGGGGEGKALPKEVVEIEITKKEKAAVFHDLGCAGCGQSPVLVGAAARQARSSAPAGCLRQIPPVLLRDGGGGGGGGGGRERQLRGFLGDAAEIWAAAPALLRRGLRRGRAHRPNLGPGVGHAIDIGTLSRHVLRSTGR